MRDALRAGIASASRHTLVCDRPSRRLAPPLLRTAWACPFPCRRIGRRIRVALRSLLAAEVARFEGHWDGEEHRLAQKAQALEDSVRAKHLQEEIAQRRKR